ncbi:MAG: response regulator [Planctomycetota bacterium]
MQNPSVSDITKHPSKVYLIDNDPALRRSVTTMLSTTGIHCRCFEQGGEFLDTYQGQGPACVVSSASLPDLSGIRLIQRLREMSFSIPVIIMAGQGEVDDVIRAFRVGAVDVFQKPITGSLLLERIQSALEHERAQRGKREQANQLRLRIAKLSQRERQVMGLLIEGMPNKEIAWQLKLSDKTIAAHRANMLTKMQVDSLAKLISSVVRYNISADAPPAPTPSRISASAA